MGKLGRFHKTLRLGIGLICIVWAAAAVAAGGYLGVGLEEKDGVVTVSAVAKGGPAAKAGILVGDAVSGVGGAKVASQKDLIARVGAASAGDRVEMTIQRDGASREITVVLGERPKPSREGGPTGVEAPEIDHITEWHNLPEGKRRVSLADYKDKTVFLYCFQSW